MIQTILLGISVLQFVITFGALIYAYRKREAIDKAVGNYVGSLACFAGELAAENFQEKLNELADEFEEQEMLQDDLAAIKVKNEVN
jgi:hypothetical protein